MEHLANGSTVTFALLLSLKVVTKFEIAKAEMTKTRT